MKLKKIQIINMHNVSNETYDLAENFTYFLGPNGAGKSTILEAIQLVILGYIPGYAKTNEAIMKHSPENEMQVIGTFDDGSMIIRKWIRSGSSVSANVETIPSNLKSNLCLVSDKLELPIYNFAEFKDLTANKLKEWFISFLPPVTDEIRWEDQLRTSLKDRAPLLSDELMNETLTKIEDLNRTYKGIELVQQLNTYFKSEQSFTKKEIDRLESTIQNLVFYEEDLPSETSTKEELDLYMNLLKRRIAFDTSKANYDSVKKQLDELNCLPVSSIEEVDQYIEMRNNHANIHSAYTEVTQAKERFETQLKSIQRQISDLSRISASTCPYTSRPCKEIETMLEENKAKTAELERQVVELCRIIAEKEKLQAELNTKLFVSTSNLQKIESQYATYLQLRDTLSSITVDAATDLSQNELNDKIKKCQESLSKIEANKKYNELIETITADKYKMQNNLEVLKIWEKLTGANGLQTTLMVEPFEAMSSDMSKYLTEMFSSPTEAHFNLISKANSFSFGLIRDSDYIEFDYLSSGERCLFMLAMMICILNKSNASLRTILVDDLIDHLDDKNADNVFAALSNVEDVQFILAGVKTCSLQGVVNI